MNRLAFLLLLPALMQTKKTVGQDSVSGPAVVLSPAVFMPVSVAVQAGLRLPLGGRFGLLAEGAYPAFYPQNTTYEKIRYWRTGLELRYAYRRQAALRKYLALQAAYLFRQLTEKDQAFYYTRTQTFSYTDAVIRSPVLSTALKAGAELWLSRRLFVDAFAGGGVRWVFSSYRTAGVPLATSLEPRKTGFFSAGDAWVFNYTLRRLHAVAGFRLGWRLRK